MHEKTMKLESEIQENYKNIINNDFIERTHFMIKDNAMVLKCHEQLVIISQNTLYLHIPNNCCIIKGSF